MKPTTPPINDTPAPRRGRPPINDTTMIRLLVYLPADLVAELRQEGAGNMSAAIRARLDPQN